MSTFFPTFELSSLLPENGGTGLSGFVINGIATFDESGTSVGGAGDVNGDGISDLIIGAPGGGLIGEGQAYVVFGSGTGFGVGLDATDLDGSNGFVITGSNLFDASGASVSAAGDVNGDGLDDLIIGTPSGGLDQTGQAHVVFGAPFGFRATLDLAALDGFNGFTIDGIFPGDLAGVSVSAAGDVNGDGLDDLIIGAPGDGVSAVGFAGESYVVFGSDAGFGTTLDLASLDGGNGFIITGVDANDASGFSVSAAGDINGDGVDDLIIGAPGESVSSESFAGESYVVFGSRQGFSAALDLASLNGRNGFTINGIDLGDNVGVSVSAAGDVNGDGLDDLIIGAPFARPNDLTEAGESYVVFGSRQGFDTAFDLAGLDGSNGFTITGADRFDLSGSSVSTAGDINGDGIADLIIGAPFASPNGQGFPGASAAIFGSRDGFGAVVDLASLDGNTGFSIIGIEESDVSGTSVSNAGDVNGDGVDDLIIGAPYASPNGDASGESYVVFGSDVPVARVAGPGVIVEGQTATLILELSGPVSGDQRVTLAVEGPAADLVSLAETVVTIPDGATTATVALVAIEDMAVTGGADITVSIESATEGVRGSDPSLTVQVNDNETLFPSIIPVSTLDGGDGFSITNSNGDGESGTSVSAAGDINGDGVDDLIIGARLASPDDRDRAGESYVVFGTGSGFSTPLDLSELDGTNGFTINGIKPALFAGASVSGAGDVNGDGIDDLIIGAPGTISGLDGMAGDSYVVFGSRDGFDASFDLAGLDGSNGFTVTGANAGDEFGSSVSAAGDVNGDGIADLIIGAESADPNDRTLAGASSVVFGSRDGFDAAINLADLDGGNGFTINGVVAFDRNGTSVSGAGDVNGDGIDDLIIGAPGVDTDMASRAGASSVVFGSRSGFTTPIDLSELDGSNGFVINGVTENREVGTSVSAAGDVNGDGIADLIIGAPGESSFGESSTGESHVIFGSRDGFGAAFDLTDLDGSNGFTIKGVDPGDLSGTSVSAAGDVNGDGIDDLIIGAPGAGPAGRVAAGASHVVFGSRDGFGATVDLADLDGINGFTLTGIDANDEFGSSVSAAGDVNGDGIDDLIIGAPEAEPNGGRFPRGESYVVFGRSADAPPIPDDPVDGLVPAENTATTVIDGVSAITGTAIDGRTGETVNAILVPAFDGATRTDSIPITPNVDVAVTPSVTASIPEDFGLLANSRTTTSQSNLRTVLAGDEAPGPEGAAALDGFIDQVLPQGSGDGLTVVMLVPQAPDDLPPGTPLTLKVTTGDSDPGALVLIRTEGLAAVDGDIALVVDGDGPVAIQGPGSVSGADGDSGPGTAAALILADDSPQALSFGPGAHIITAGGGDDTIDGGAGNDTLTGGPGNDLVFGGPGADTAHVDGNRADFTVARSVFGYQVTDIRDPASPSTDILIGVETLAFTDGAVAPGDAVGSGFTLYSAITASTGRQVYASGSRVDLIDAPEGQVFDIALGASISIRGVNGPNTINLEGSAADYLIAADGTRFLLIGPDQGGLAMVPDVAAQTLIFADGQVDLTIGAGGEMALGDQIVPEALAGITATLDGDRTSSGVFEGLGGGTVPATGADDLFA